MSEELEPCPECGDSLIVCISEGGRGTKDLALYAASCSGCGLYENGFGGHDGRRRSAIREYNRWSKSQKAPSMTKETTQ